MQRWTEKLIMFLLDLPELCLCVPIMYAADCLGYLVSAGIDHVIEPLGIWTFEPFVELLNALGMQTELHPWPRTMRGLFLK